MIITAVLLLAASLWTLAINQLPTGSLPAGVLSSVEYFISLLGMIDPIFDTTTLMTIVALFFFIETAIVAADFLFWVWSKIPVFGK